jgi:conjugative relaxase-like TrwC/TraI family protein
VLSISKINSGHARYYVDEAGDRVDAAESIGDGVEEYYTGPSVEARGSWFGAGARELGLHGEVGGDALRRALDGMGRDGQPLRDSSSRVKVAGYDFTFSAPKSVSVLFAVGGPELQEAIRRAHDRAVLAAAGHLERTAAFVRRGHGGHTVEPASGLVAGLFRHRTSRVGDPQVHTHVVIPNLGRGPDGRWSALDGRRLYGQARTASFVYQAVLRSELTRSLGVEWTLVRRGIAEVAGVPKPVMRAFSRRRAQIEAELERRGTSGPHASEAAALSTRCRKDRTTGSEELEAEWRRRAGELGFTREAAFALLGRSRRRAMEPEWERIFAVLASPVGLTRQKSTFDRRDVIQALCEQIPVGFLIDARDAEAAADRFLASGRAVALLPDNECFRRRDGRLLPVAREQLRYSTPELLAREQQLLDRALGPPSGSIAPAPPAAVVAAVSRRPTLTEEQRRMVEHVCLSNAGVVVVAGKAGTGKTFALAAAREAFQTAGHPVLGVAVARRAARELHAGAGIHATSTAALLQDLANGKPLPRSCVLVVDEAGMASTRQLATLLEHVERADGKLVLVGDHRQLPEIEAGGAFRALVARGAAVELTQNQRQAEQWERRALDHVADGRAEQAIAHYREHDRIHIAQTAPDTRTHLVEDWWQRFANGEDAIILAHRRTDVAQLNAQAREQLRAQGRLRGAALELPGGTFAAGDHVIVKRNDRHYGVTNGDRGQVMSVDPAHQRLTIRIDDRDVELGRGFLHDTTDRGDPTLAHGYALTCHVAQGITVDHAFLLADHGLSKELAYTALSRGRKTNHLYLTSKLDDPRVEYAPTEPARDPIARITTMLSTTSAEQLAIDVDPSVLVREAEQRLQREQSDRRSLEQARWTPQRRHRLAAAQRREADAAAEVASARRSVVERSHGSRPFVTERELDERGDARTQRLLERASEARHRERGRGIDL